MRLPLEVVRRLPGVMFARVTGNVLAYGAELVPVVGGVISGGVGAHCSHPAPESLQRLQRDVIASPC
jgi:hypothetical protein